VAALYSAFSQAPRPKREEITPHKCLECDEVACALAPYEAAAVPSEALDRVCYELSLFGPQAFRYYFPRFVEHSLKNPPSILAERLGLNLRRASELDTGDRDRIKDFTVPALRTLLWYVTRRLELNDPDDDRDELHRALAYWSGRV
jgi:hypothetical protein